MLNNKLYSLRQKPACARVENHKAATRSELVSAVRERLSRTGFPRFQMLIIVMTTVMTTGLSGFLASVVLLRWQLRAMWLRYGLCVALAYLTFLLLLRLWIHQWGRFAPASATFWTALTPLTFPGQAERAAPAKP